MVFAIKVRLEINSKIFPYSYVTIIEIPTRMGDNSSSFSGKFFFFISINQKQVFPIAAMFEIRSAKKNGIFLMSYNKTTEDAICLSFRENPPPGSAPGFNGKILEFCYFSPNL
jgi:hypothetical protein